MHIHSKCMLHSIKYYLKYLDIKALPGTCSFHQFIPLNTTLIGAKRYSRQVDFTMTFISQNKEELKSIIL